MRYYILNPDRSFRPAKTNQEYYDWSNNFVNQIVSKTHINNDVYVSTVFLGLDHSFNSETPILFETMIFGGEHDEFQERYYTWSEAVEGHLKALDMARESLQKAAVTH